MMRFAHPQMLWLLALLPLALWLAWRQAGAPGRRMAGPDPGELARRLLPGWSRGRALAKGLLTSLALGLWILAASGPQLGTREVEVKRQGVDVVVAVDVSQSMAAQDLAPDRMGRARHSIRRLLENLEGDRVALLPFSGAAFLQHPLTSDYALSGVFTDLLRPGLIPQAGTDLGAAIRRAVATYQETAPGQRVLIILSDGEDFEEGWRDALAEARESGVVIHTVGMGTPEGAPVPDPARPGSYKLDRSGSVVFSRLDEGVLQELATQGGGSYQRSTPGGEELAGILERIGELEGRELGSRHYAGWEERFPLLLAPGLLLLLAAWAWPARRRSAGLPALLGFLLLAASARADHVGRNNQGLREYREGRYGAAAEEFGQSLTHQETAQARHNLGTALYRSGDLEGAAAQFRAAAGQAQLQGDRPLAARSWANLGRTLLDQEQLEPAIQALEEALIRQPGLAEARHNLELALRRQEEQSSQDQQDKQDNQDQQQDKRQQDQQQQQQQDQQQQQQGQEGQQEQAEPQEQAQAQDGQGREERIDPAQLQQLLNAVEAQERQAQERQLKRQPASPRKVEKDW